MKSSPARQSGAPRGSVVVSGVPRARLRGITSRPRPRPPACRGGQAFERAGRVRHGQSCCPRLHLDRVGRRGGKEVWCAPYWKLPALRTSRCRPSAGGGAAAEAAPPAGSVVHLLRKSSSVGQPASSMRPSLVIACSSRAIWPAKGSNQRWSSSRWVSQVRRWGRRTEDDDCLVVVMGQHHVEAA